MLHALCVGINEHADGRLPTSRFACSDAEAVSALLGERLGTECQTTLLLDRAATKARVASALTDEFPRRVRTSDTVLLFFAGHGCPELEAPSPDPSLHLVTADTDYTRLFATSINMMSELSAWIRRLPASLVVVALDAAFSGSPGGRTFEGPGLRSGLRVRNRARLPIAKLAVGDRCAILAACGDDEVAREETSYAHGVFSHHFLRALGACLGDENLSGGPAALPAGEPAGSDGTGRADASASTAGVSPFTIHREVSSAVRECTAGRQTPMLVQGIHATSPLFRLRADVRVDVRPLQRVP